MINRVVSVVQSFPLYDNVISHFNQSVDYIQSWINRWVRWRPTSAHELDLAESKVLSFLKEPFRAYYVDIGNGWGLENNKIWTLEMTPQNSVEPQKQGLPLVLMHGFAAGVGLWALNLDAISNCNRKVYAFDVLGFGKSSRPYFDKSEAAELEIVESVERWRSEVGLNDKFILLGHSFGGYLALSYALQYPERVSHLILADPWGMLSQHMTSHANQFQIPSWVRFSARLMFQTFTPLAGLRAAGPWGPKLVERLRPDLMRKFEKINGKESAECFLNYIYHINAQPNPSGELAFKHLSGPPGWPRYPMLTRVSDLHHDIGITFMYGARSWIDRQSGFQTKYLLGDRVDVNVIQGSGHHIYADKPEEFNDLVIKTCYLADGKSDTNENIEQMDALID